MSYDPLYDFELNHHDPIWCLQVLEDNPTLLCKSTVEFLESKAYDKLSNIPDNPRTDIWEYIFEIISAAALLETCLGKSPTEHVSEKYNRIKQRLDCAKVNVALNNMSLKDGKAAQVEATKLDGYLYLIRERFGRPYLAKLNQTWLLYHA
ncbi:hypothetical protein MY10362_001688 [Beauveria mimosiformis]